ncbi:MAG: carbon-nitrogen hydrolase family protein [Rhodobacteraceae bacterium]|nr:carbon-nitrogen hydrolase family protein [Paracoccaceae bacterium]
MKAALLQMTAGPDVGANAEALVTAVRDAATSGADMLFTPEVSNCMGASRKLQQEILHLEEDDSTLAALCEAAAKAGVWVSVGSLALKTEDTDGRFANRSFLINGAGDIVSRYDKIHMFDVDLSESETYRESSAYRPGDRAVIAKTPWGKIGHSICYDLRFAHLYRDLAQAGADILIVPSAFARPTGEAHWHTLLRARAIETGCFVLASAQTGVHGESRSGPRATFGHSLAVGPWGGVLHDAGTEPGLSFVDLDLADVAKARGKIASLTHDRPYAKP